MTPAEIQAAIAVFQILEPMAQAAIAKLIHKIHGQTITAQDLLDQAAALLAKPC